MSQQEQNVNTLSEEQLFEFHSALNIKRAEILAEAATWIYRIHSTMLIASTTILTLLVTLKPEPTGNQHNALNHICTFRSVPLILSVICVLALLASLIQQRLACRQIARKLHYQQKYIQEHGTVSPDVVIYKGKPIYVPSGGDARIFAICEWIAYVSFVLIILCLVLQVIFNL